MRAAQRAIYADGELRIAAAVSDNTTGSFFSGNPSKTRVGWVIGGGVEYAITNNVTIKGEYLYADLGSSSFNSVGNAASALAFPGVSVSGKVGYNASIFRAPLCSWKKNGRSSSKASSPRWN